MNSSLNYLLFNRFESDPREPDFSAPSRCFCPRSSRRSAFQAAATTRFPTLEEQAKAKWADVQNQYQRRSDLIPNLVATVQGYAKQEKDVLTSVVEARAKATSVRIDASQLTDPDKLKQFQDAQAQLSGALGRLLAVSENYPDLKSNQNFLALQSQLEGTENRISVARRDYIEAVRAYNLSLKTLPSLLWAATFFRGNKPMAEFAANEVGADAAASQILTAAFAACRAGMMTHWIEFGAAHALAQAARKNPRRLAFALRRLCSRRLPSSGWPWPMRFRR